MKSYSATRVRYPLSQRKIIKKTIVQILSWGVIVFFAWLYINVIKSTGSEAGVFYPIFEWVYRHLVLIFVAGTTLSFLYQYWYYITYHYELEVGHVTIRKGPITPTEVIVTYDRIQDIYVDQDIFDRIFGLYDVHISSATISSGVYAHIDGVLKSSAFGLRDELLAEVKKTKGNNQAV